ncbi:putative transcription factor, K-box [Helianthus anomalus]
MILWKTVDGNMGLLSKTLERYQRCSYGTLELNQQNPDEQSSYQEYLKLKAKVDILQQSQRHYLGEGLEWLGSKDLDQLERQMDLALRQVRLTKTKHMLDQLTDLQQKEQSLLEANKNLRSELEESTMAYQLSWQAHERNIDKRRPPVHLDCNDNIRIGYNNEAPNDGRDVPSRSQNTNGVIPVWML